MPTYPFHKTDGGRFTSLRSRQTNDCTVRAIASTRRLSYDDAYDLLKGAGRQSGRTFRIHTWLTDKPWATWTPFLAVKGQRRIDPTRFCDEHPKGSFICRAAKHVFAVIDGVVYDDTPVREGACIYGAWEIRP